MGAENNGKRGREKGREMEEKKRCEERVGAENNGKRGGEKGREREKDREEEEL